MNKKETINPKEARNQNYEAKKMNTSENSKRIKNNYKLNFKFRFEKIKSIFIIC